MSESYAAIREKVARKYPDIISTPMSNLVASYRKISNEPLDIADVKKDINRWKSRERRHAQKVAQTHDADRRRFIEYEHQIRNLHQQIHANIDQKRAWEEKEHQYQTIIRSLQDRLSQQNQQIITLQEYLKRQTDLINSLQDENQSLREEIETGIACGLDLDSILSAA